MAVALCIRWYGGDSKWGPSMSHGCLFAYMFAHNAHIRVLRKKGKKMHINCVFILLKCICNMPCVLCICRCSLCSGGLCTMMYVDSIHNAARMKAHSEWFSITRIIHIYIYIFQLTQHINIYIFNICCGYFVALYRGRTADFIIDWHVLNNFEMQLHWLYFCFRFCPLQ